MLLDSILSIDEEWPAGRGGGEGAAGAVQEALLIAHRRVKSGDERWPAGGGGGEGVAGAVQLVLEGQPHDGSDAQLPQRAGGGAAEAGLHGRPPRLRDGEGGRGSLVSLSYSADRLG